MGAEFLLFSLYLAVQIVGHPFFVGRSGRIGTGGDRPLQPTYHSYTPTPPPPPTHYPLPFPLPPPRLTRGRGQPGIPSHSLRSAQECQYGMFVFPFAGPPKGGQINDASRSGVCLTTWRWRAKIVNKDDAATFNWLLYSIQLSDYSTQQLSAVDRSDGEQQQQLQPHDYQQQQKQQKQNSFVPPYIASTGSELPISVTWSTRVLLMILWTAFDRLLWMWWFCEKKIEWFKASQK